MPSPRFLMRHLRRLFPVLLAVTGATRALAAQAQDTTGVRTTTVTYLAGSSVYVGAGRADGLVEGQELQVIRRESVAATLRVVFLSSRQASCTVVSGATAIQVGEIVHYVATAQAAPAAGTVATTTQRRSGSRRLSGQGIHGRIGARYFVAREDSTSSGFSQPTADLRLDGQQVGGSPVGLAVDLRTRRTTTTRADGSSVVDGHTRVYQAALHWNAPGARFHTVVGRQYLTAVTSISLFDGALMELNGTHLSFGGFGGLEPEPTNLGFSKDISDFGAYVQGHSKPGSPNIWSLTTGAVGSYANGRANREFGFAQLSVSTRVLSLYGLQEVDYYRPWKVAAGESSISWTSSYLSGSIRPNRWLAFNGSYDNRRNVRLYRDFIDPSISFDDTYRQGVAGGVSVIGRQIRVGAEVRRSTGQTAGDATSYSGTFGLDRVTPLKLSFTTRGTWYDNPNLSGKLFTLRVGADPWQPLHVDLNGGIRREDNPAASSSLRKFTWYGLDFDLSLARAWFLSFSGQRETGPDGNTNQFFGGLTWRF